MFAFDLNALSQYEQLYKFSPVCHAMCSWNNEKFKLFSTVKICRIARIPFQNSTFRFLFRLNALSQIVHWWNLSQWTVRMWRRNAFSCFTDLSQILHWTLSKLPSECWYIICCLRLYCFDSLETTIFEIFELVSSHNYKQHLPSTANVALNFRRSRRRMFAFDVGCERNFRFESLSTDFTNLIEWSVVNVPFVEL